MRGRVDLPGADGSEPGLFASVFVEPLLGEAAGDTGLPGAGLGDVEFCACVSLGTTASTPMAKPRRPPTTSKPRGALISERKGIRAEFNMNRVRVKMSIARRNALENSVSF